jgi:hypothetical protein
MSERASRCAYLQRAGASGRCNTPDWITLTGPVHAPARFGLRALVGAVVTAEPTTLVA